MRFSNILLFLDSDTGYSLALRRAIALARNEFATLTICDVVDRVPANFLRNITGVTPQEVMDSVVASKFKRIEKAIQSCETKGVSIEVKVLVGKPHLKISRLVITDHHDLVIKSIAGPKANSIKKSDRELMRSCPCPVWLVNDADQSENDCVLAALDMPVDGGVSAEMNQHILEAARSIALAEFRRLHVVHAWHLVEEGHMKARGGAATELELDRMILHEAAKRMSWLQDTVKTSRSDSQRIANDYLAPELHVVKGSPKMVVPDLADELGAGLIVMGSAARTGVSGIWLGNTSEKVLSRSDSSLLIVKLPQEASELPAMNEARRQLHNLPGAMEEIPYVSPYIAPRRA
jgi:nucleotide-binding universal stress UspA family protein